MPLNVEDPNAAALAQRLAAILHLSVPDAVVVALKEAIRKRERPRETAQRILAKRGLTFRPDRRPPPATAYHDLDHDLGGTR
jgi:antitoxin VapB